MKESGFSKSKEDAPRNPQNGERKGKQLPLEQSGGSLGHSVEGSSQLLSSMICGPLLSLREKRMVESPLEKEDTLKQLPIPSRQFPDPPETQTGPGSLQPAEIHKSPITSGYSGSEPRLGLGCLD